MDKKQWVTDEDLTTDGKIIYQRNSETGAIREVVKNTDGSQDITYFADEPDLGHRVQSSFEHFAPDGALTEVALFQEGIPTWKWGFNEIGVYETVAELDKNALISRTFRVVNGQVEHILKTKEIGGDSNKEAAGVLTDIAEILAARMPEPVSVKRVGVVKTTSLILSEISLKPSVDDPNMIKVLKTRYHNIGNQLNGSVTYAGEFDERDLSQKVMLTPVSGARYNQKGEPIAVDVSDFESISFYPQKEAVIPERNIGNQKRKNRENSNDQGGNRREQQ